MSESPDLPKGETDAQLFRPPNLVGGVSVVVVVWGVYVGVKFGVGVVV